MGTLLIAPLPKEASEVTLIDTTAFRCPATTTYDGAPKFGVRCENVLEHDGPHQAKVEMFLTWGVEPVPEGGK